MKMQHNQWKISIVLFFLSLIRTTLADEDDMYLSEGDLNLGFGDVDYESKTAKFCLAGFDGLEDFIIYYEDEDEAAADFEMYVGDLEFDSILREIDGVPKTIKKSGEFGGMDHLEAACDSRKQMGN